jgi:ABC-type multidrug transport system permease subunit
MALIPQIMLAGVLAKISTLPVELLSYLTISRWGTEGFSNIQKNIVIGSEKVMQDGIVQELKNSTNTNQALLNQFHTQYTNKTFFDSLTGTMRLDIYALIFITVILFSLTVYFLKKKDTI